MLKEQISAALGAAGYRHKFAPISIVEKLHAIVLDLRQEGLLSDRVYHQYIQYLDFVPSADVPEPRTLIVVVSPSPAVKVSFDLDSGPLEAVIPPTYIGSENRARGLQVLRSVLEPAGHAVAPARLPYKLLAAQTGLARYLRTNLIYVPGMGTFARLDAFCTDADLGAEEYKIRGSLLMGSCPPCRNCHHVCPTGCIPYNGTVIDATRCLTYINENEGQWPEWLDPKAHNALVGCMRCQVFCPQDRYYLRKEKTVAEFDREETKTILENRPPERLPAALRRKLDALDLTEYSPVLGRNLLALRQAAGGAEEASR